MSKKTFSVYLERESPKGRAKGPVVEPNSSASRETSGERDQCYTQESRGTREVTE